MKVPSKEGRLAYLRKAFTSDWEGAAPVRTSGARWGPQSPGLKYPAAQKTLTAHIVCGFYCAFASTAAAGQRQSQRRLQGRSHPMALLASADYRP